MESVALSRTTRWGMLLTGLLQGVLLPADGLAGTTK